MPHGFQGAVIRMLGAKEHLLTVRDTRRLAAHFARITFEAGTLFTQVTPGPAAWLRLWVIDPETGGEFQRAYTIAGVDTDAGLIDIDFLLHEPAGPASAWAAQAAEGQTVIAQSLGSTTFRPVVGATSLLVVGDAASLPAVNAVLNAAPVGLPVEVILERAHDEDERIPMSVPARATVRWVPRDGTASLTAAVAETLGNHAGSAQAWVAGEAGSLKSLRPLLRDRIGSSRRHSHVQAYWAEGRAMGTARPTA